MSDLSKMTTLPAKLLRDLLTSTSVSDDPTPESIGLRHGIRVPPGYTVVGGAIVRVDDPTPTTNPQDQDYWPKDSLHDAARQVVGGMKGLVPNARRTLREAAERADAAPVGRAASDAAIGRALRIGL